MRPQHLGPRAMLNTSKDDWSLVPEELEPDSEILEDPVAVKVEHLEAATPAGSLKAAEDVIVVEGRKETRRGGIRKFTLMQGIYSAKETIPSMTTLSEFAAEQKLRD